MSLIKFVKTFIKETPTQVFSCEICKMFKNTYFEEHQQASVFNKVAGFAKYLRTPISKNIYERLLLSIDLFPKGSIFCETLLYSEAATGVVL